MKSTEGRLFHFILTMSRHKDCLIITCYVYGHIDDFYLTWIAWVIRRLLLVRLVSHDIGVSWWHCLLTIRSTLWGVRASVCCWRIHRLLLTVRSWRIRRCWRVLRVGSRVTVRHWHSWCWNDCSVIARLNNSGATCLMHGVRCWSSDRLMSLRGNHDGC